MCMVYDYTYDSVCDLHIIGLYIYYYLFFNPHVTQCGMSWQKVPHGSAVRLVDHRTGTV